MATPSNSKAWILVGFAALSAGAIAGATFFSAPSVQLHAATLLQIPRPIADFQLIDQSGQPANLNFLKSQWTVLFAGFTSCPNICPTTLALLKQVTAPLDAQTRPRVVLLTVDPERDTPERMKKYLAQFDPQFRGLTGDAQALSALRANLGLVAAKVNGPTADTYTVDHSAAVVLINPQGEIAGYLSPPFDAAALTGDLRQLSKISG